MVLEWRTSEVEHFGKKVKVTHWQKHDPRDLLDALKSPPFSESPPESLPGFTVHKFGSHLLLARRFAREDIIPLRWSPPVQGLRRAYAPAGHVFSSLQELVKKRAAVLEMPVALIEKSNGDAVVVTLWKKHKMSLTHYLQDNGVPTREKAATMYSALRQLARLNAAGFVCQHPFVRNFVVLENGEARLVDPSVARFFGAGPASVREGEAAIDSILTNTYGLEADVAATAEWRGRLRREYWRFSEHYQTGRPVKRTLSERTTAAWQKLLAAWRRKKYGLRRIR